MVDTSSSPSPHSPSPSPSPRGSSPKNMDSSRTHVQCPTTTLESACVLLSACTH